MSQLSLKNITVAYGDKIILENLNVEINKGEFVSIIGPNGTGKSTLIKAITDLIDVKNGVICIDGRKNSNISRKERAKLIAVVPQEFNIDFDFNAFDIVMMGRNPHQYGKDKDPVKDYEVVNEAMLMTNTWQLKDRYFNELSGGERQRIIIARAIAQQSDIILLDEPTSHLDVHHQLEVLELVRMLNKNKKITVLAVLHDINMAARFSDRLILLNEKKVLADGPPDYVVDEKILGKVYAMEMLVRNNNLLSSKEVIPIRVIKEKKSMEGVKVHVIGGGGSGEQILERLNSLGVDLSSGVVNQGDSDWEICKMLKITTVEGKPFSEIDDKTHKENIELIKEADFILVTDVPFGSGNLKNLQALTHADCPIFMIKRDGPFDYTEGKAEKILESLKNTKQFEYLESYDEFVELICKGERK
nr:ABC transporter ATP-binding protein [Alkalibacter mobilis]